MIVSGKKTIGRGLKGEDNEVSYRKPTSLEVKVFVITVLSLDSMT